MEEKVRKSIAEGVEILKRGGLVAYPTDTVYGLGAVYDNDTAVRNVYEVKNRPLTMPLPLLLADISWLDNFAININPIARKLADAFFPGALTLVFEKSAIVPDTVSGGQKTVALRVPGHPITLMLIEKAGKPVIGTSANLSGSPSALTAEEVKRQIGDKIDYIIDGGKCPGGTESTILDVTGDRPVILRYGAISVEAIEKVCERKILEKE